MEYIFIIMIYFFGLPIFVAALAIVLIYLIFNIRYQLSPLRCLPGRDKFTHPVFGDMADFLNSATVMGKYEYQPCEYGHVRRSQEYWGRTRIEVQDINWINHMLVTNASNYVRSKYIGVEDLEIYAGQSLLILDGEDHKRLRKIAAPAFRPGILKGLVSVMETTAERLIVKWDARCVQSGGIADISVRSDLAHLSLDILGLCMFGHEFNAMDGESNTANLIYELSKSQMPTKLGTIPGYKKLLWIILKLVRSNLPLVGPQADRLKTIRMVFQETDRAVKSQQFRTTYSSMAPYIKRPILNQSALFDCISAAYIDNKITRSEMVELFLNFLAAGLDTTSVALTWTLLLLANHPDVQARCHAEVEAFNKELDGKPLSWEYFNGSKSRLPWCKAVIQESMRLFPPIPHIIRTPLEDDTINGCTIPAGTNIVIQLINVHRSKNIWGPTADSFDPERFLSPDVDIDPNSYMPFADGRHKCIGNQFAMTHMQITLSKLVANFEFFRMAGDTGIPLEKCTVTLAPWNELILKTRKR